MARSWRNFFRRSKEPEEGSATAEAVDQPTEVADGETNGAAPPEDAAPSDETSETSLYEEAPLDEVVEPEEIVQPAEQVEAERGGPELAEVLEVGPDEPDEPGEVEEALPEPDAVEEAPESAEGDATPDAQE